MSWKRPDGETVVLLDREHDGMSFNDLTADPDGRIYVGSLLFEPLDGGTSDGRPVRHRARRDGRKVHGDVSLTNGLGVSTDGTALYNSDTGARPCGVTTGRPTAACRVGGRCTRRPSARTGRLRRRGRGSVWLAMAATGEVVGVTANGTVVERGSPSRSRWSRACASAAPTCSSCTWSPATVAPKDVRRGDRPGAGPHAGASVPAARVVPDVSVGAPVPTATVNGIDIYYERGGEGPPLLFCNGSGADARVERDR